MKIKFSNLLKSIITLLFVTIMFSAMATDKVVTITGDATYSGTYIVQSGTRDSYPYYKHSTQNLYLYVDDYLNSWNTWVIGTLVEESSYPDAGTVKYYQYPLNPDPGSSGGGSIWYVSLSNAIISITITDAASGVAPTVTTDEASLVTTTSGTMNGNIVADGGATASRGFVYSLSTINTNPLIGGTGVTQVTKGTGTGTYTEMIGSLTPGATYYYKAYGINTYGTTYGSAIFFTTPTTSEPNKFVSGITNPSASKGIYIWIGNYYNKPAWKHQTLDYWLYYSRYGAAFPTTYYWYIDDLLSNEHGAEDYLFYHTDAASCPSSGWTTKTGTGTPSVVDYPNIEFANGSAYSSGNPIGGTNNNPIGRFFMDADISGASLTGVTIGVAGTRANISNLKLWSSTDATFSSGSDTQLNSQSDGSTVTFSGFSSSVSTSGTYYFITTDLAMTATGSFTLTIGSKSNLTISSGAIASDFSNAALTSGTITITPAIEINLKGNSVSINDGDTTPDTSDHTDFGNADIVTGSVVCTFTIENIAAGTLSLTDTSPYVVISGATSEFTLTQIPSNSISGSSSTTFQVTFNPTSAGLKSATVSIANNDTNENPYNFDIQGTGITAPEMDVSGNSISIADGDAVPSVSDHTDFGDVNITSASVEYTFSIINSGSAQLNLTAASPYIVITGHTDDFTLTQTPSSSIAAGGGTTTFKVTFNPTTTGTRSATISIANDDGDENPYNFSIQGKGITTPSLTTSAATSIGTTTSTLGGNVTSDGGVTVTGRGVVYSSTDSTPEIGEDGVTQNTNGDGTGVFSESIGSLSLATHYYYQAYAINSEGTSYGGVQEFTTQNTILSVVRSGSNPTNAGSVSWTVTFSASVTGLTSTNFSLANTGLTDPSITDVTGSGTSWTITASTGTGSGSLGLNLANATNLNSGLSNSLPYSGQVYTIDKESPLLSTSTPADNTTTVYMGANIVLTFNDDMAAGTGNITIRKISDNSILEQIAIADAKITISSNQVTINPSNTLAKGTAYYVEIDATALDDDAGNSFAGISGSSTLNFTTVNVVINEVVTEAQQDWSTNDFNGIIGSGSVNEGTDEWVELLINSTGLNLTGWTIELLDGSDVIGNLTNTGAFDVSRYIGSGSFTNTSSGDYLVLGNVDGIGAMNNSITINLKDTSGAIVDVVTLFLSGNPSANSDDRYNESAQRFPNGLDTDSGSSDFTQGQASMGAANTGPSVKLSVSSSSIAENNASSIVTATLSAKSSQITTINITATGTGTSGTDYSLSSGTITIPAGSLTGTDTITSIQDTKDEENETVILDITGVTNGTEAGVQQQTITITDDDAEPTVSLSLTGSPFAENGGTATVTATLSAVSGKNAIINLGFTGTATGGGTDYTSSASSITINAGSTSGSITLTGVDDADDDNDETVIVDMTGGTNCTEDGTQQVTATITDDENPEISITGKGQNIGDGDTAPSSIDDTEFGNTDINVGEVTHTFTITNSGAGALHLLGSSPFITITGHTTDFEVILSPLSTIASGGGSTTFDIKFNPTSLGLRQATVSISSDDSDEDPFTFYIQGTGGNYPEIAVECKGMVISDGDASPGQVDGTDFGQDHFNLEAYSPIHTFHIINYGSGTLNLSGTPRITLSGTDFTLTQDAPVSIPAGDTAEFKIKFAASAVAVRSGTISISNDDSSENPYNFSITGEGHSGSLMIVQGGSPQLDIEDGDTIPGSEDYTDFGRTIIDGGTIDKIFKIENFGAGNLILSGTPIVSITGAGAADYTIIDQPATPIGSSSNDTFTIRFDPSTTGTKIATVSIANNDPNRNPYTFKIKGDGGTPPTGSNEADTLCENQAYTFTSDYFTFNDADGDSFAGIKIITVETAGELKYNNVDVTAGLDCPDVSKLVFIPQSNTHGSPYATFTFKVKDDQGVYSDAAYTMTISVLPEFIAGTLTENQTLCYNITPDKLIGSAPTGGLTPYIYQWQRSSDGTTFTDIVSETTIEYQPPALTQTTYYRILQTPFIGCGTIATNIVTITVHDEFQVGSISESQAVYFRTKPDKLVGTAPTGGTTPYSYQWQSSEDGTDFTDIHGAIRLDYQPESLSNTTYFRLIQSSASGCGTLITNVVSVAVYPEFVVGSISADQRIVYNTVPEKLIGKEPRGGRHPYSYQWQNSTDGANFTDIVSATDLDYQPSVLTDTTYYRLIQSSAYDFADKATNTITIYVYPKFAVGSISEDQTVCYNTTPNLLIGTEPTGGDLPFTYQWQSSTDGVNFTDISGTNALNYQAPAITAKTYFRQIQTSASNCGSLVTNIVMMTIQAQPTVDIGVDQAMICPNQGYQLSATAENYESVTWTSLGDGSFSDVNILNPVYTPGQNDILSGSVTLVVNAIGISACEMLASDQMVLSFYTTPQVNAGNDLTVYENSQQQINATVNGSGNYIYTWSPADMVSDPTILNPITNPISETTTFTLLVSDIETGCSFQDQVTFKVESGITYQISGTISTISLKNTLPVTNVFYTGINKTTITNNQGQYSMMVPAGYSGWAIPSRPGYVFEPDSIAYFNVGEDIAEQNIGGSLFMRAFAYPDSITVGQSVQLSFEVYGSQNQICCSWMDHYGIICSSEHSPIVMPTETTLYTVVVEDGFERTFDTVRVYVSTTTGIDDLEIDKGKILLYPNPTKNMVHLEINGEFDAQIISIVNPTGILVRQIKLPKSVNDHKVEINLENLIKGSYYILITNSKGELIATKKVIKI